jgi:hypothetical protein
MKRRLPGSRELKLWTAAKRRSYIGLLIGLGIGVVLVTLLLAQE